LEVSGFESETIAKERQYTLRVDIGTTGARRYFSFIDRKSAENDLTVWCKGLCALLKQIVRVEKQLEEEEAKLKAMVEEKRAELGLGPKRKGAFIILLACVCIPHSVVCFLWHAWSFYTVV
jgi:hypothetical protein